MLIEFSVENYLSFKDLNTLKMMGVKAFKELKESNTFKIDKDERLLKSACIYGNNASGKSNLLDSISFMKGFVLNSFRDALLENSDSSIPLKKFKLNEKSLDEPSYLEVVFIKNEIKYRYGFELDYDRVVNEWLYRTKSREVPLFIRQGQDFEINNSSFSEGVKLDSKTKENVLFLTLVAQLNGETSNSVIDWFKSLNTISGIHDGGYKRYTTKKLKEDDDFKRWATEFANFLEITDIGAGEKEIEKFEVEDLDEENTEKELLNIITNLQSLAEKNPKRDEVITWHNRFNEDNILIDTVPFDFDREESEGTKKFIHLLGPWYDTLKNGKVLLVDELDSRLHTLLTLKLVQLFHEQNKSKAQIIFAAHDTNLMDKTIFRRDQIWFVEKNQFGASELYSLSDFKSSRVRKNTAFEKNYMMGKYGAIPYIEGEEKLVELLNE